MFRALMVMLVIALLTACTQTKYIDSGNTESLGQAVSALLLKCTEAQVGKVGNTNESLVMAYVKTREGLLICKSVSEGIRGTLVGGK